MKTSFEPSTVKIHPAVRPGRLSEKKNPGQDNKEKKAKQRNISDMWGELGEAPANDNATTFGTASQG